MDGEYSRDRPIILLPDLVRHLNYDTPRAVGFNIYIHGLDMSRVHNVDKSTVKFDQFPIEYVRKQNLYVLSRQTCS